MCRVILFRVMRRLVYVGLVDRLVLRLMILGLVLMLISSAPLLRSLGGLVVARCRVPVLGL